MTLYREYFQGHWFCRVELTGHATCNFPISSRGGRKLETVVMATDNCLDKRQLTNSECDNHASPGHVCIMETSSKLHIYLNACCNTSYCHGGHVQSQAVTSQWMVERHLPTSQRNNIQSQHYGMLGNYWHHQFDIIFIAEHAGQCV